MHNAEMQHEII